MRGVLERTDRVWASDCIDPLERQQIQRWTALLLPPEMIGSHIGSSRSHTTGRTHTIDFRAGSAFFGHFGLEWDLRDASAAELDRVAEWVTTHRRVRTLLHSGAVVRGDHPDPALWVHGVVAHDGSRAIYALVQTATSVHSPPGPVRLPGLDRAATYRVTPLPPGDHPEGPVVSEPSWWRDGLIARGSTLATVGIQAPAQFPESLVLLDVVRQG